MSLNVKELGQVFTPKRIVSDMINLIRNEGTILEPSCGDGAFFNELPGCVGIEFDNTVAPAGAMIMDFFDFPLKNKFDTIIGNPPYVRFQDIGDSTKQKLDMSLFDERSNLYLFFIHKCIQHLNPHGELIFIVPRDFLKATASIKLNHYIYEHGSITDIIDLGDERIFQDACPNCVIFRFEKDNFKRKTNVTKNFSVVNGQILFTDNKYRLNFSDLFYVKVGAVSGCNEYFVSPNGNMDFVYSKTGTTGDTIRMHYNTYHPELLPHKQQLLARSIKRFTEQDWFMWGRKYYESNATRIYVNAKTRNTNPFFFHPCKAYDGSVLAIFPKWSASEKECRELAALLNRVDWQELGFCCDGRYLFTQKSLENCVLPNSFEKFMPLARAAQPANYVAKKHPLTGDVMWKIVNTEQHIVTAHEFITKYWNPEYTLSFYDQWTGVSMEITNEVEDLKNDIIEILSIVTNTEHSLIDWIGINSMSDSYVIAIDFSRRRFKPGTLYKYQNKQLKSL